ncbi:MULTISPECIES: hypothetical protein [unclassified Streptomyces]|uniref:hypothetical protein n=1 Tax=unclassified Streptomyces TaxID=2593676 RepID=UPI000B510FBE|nr:MULTISPECIES: hypothetical protein [unclassified Streptomyces]MYX04234.1 hypothetical protein [Streptomyces sp. SID8378]
MRPYVAVEIDGVLSPYGGPLPAGHSVHEVESAAWRDWAAMVYPRPYGLRLALDPAVGRALADLPADLVLVSSYAPAELEPLLPALGWDTLPPMVPLRNTGTVHYLRVDDPGRFPDAEDDLRWRTEEIAFWAQTHDRPVAWVRAGDHHEQEVRSAARRMYSTVGPLLPYAVAPAAGLTADDLQALRAWVREMDALPELAPVVPRRCRDCGDRRTIVLDGRRRDRVHEECGSCCECYCPAPGDDTGTFQPCGDLMRQQCPDCRSCLVCVGCHCDDHW